MSSKKDEEMFDYKNGAKNLAKIHSDNITMIPCEGPEDFFKLIDPDKIDEQLVYNYGRYTKEMIKEEAKRLRDIDRNKMNKTDSDEEEKKCVVDKRKRTNDNGITNKKIKKKGGKDNGLK